MRIKSHETALYVSTKWQQISGGVGKVQAGAHRDDHSA
jgi:hypothetical protein